MQCPFPVPVTRVNLAGFSDGMHALFFSPGTRVAVYLPGVSHWAQMSQGIPCQPKSLCAGLTDDFKTAREFAREFSDRPMVVRYADLVLNTVEVTKRMLSFCE